jgi:hypothetical protein
MKGYDWGITVDICTKKITDFLEPYFLIVNAEHRFGCEFENINNDLKITIVFVGIIRDINLTISNSHSLLVSKSYPIEKIDFLLQDIKKIKNVHQLEYLYK